MMQLKKYWKAIVAVVLLIAFALVLSNYFSERQAHQAEVDKLQSNNQMLQNKVDANMKYEGVQDQLEDASAQLMASRLELYQKFPVEMKEEDQIMYVLYLEKIFGTEIFFSFGQAQPMTVLKDGAKVMGLTLTVNYQTSYDGFKDMIDYLATDSRVTSVQFAQIQYDAATDTAVGTVTLLLYLIDSDLLDYVSPEVNEPETGKDNIFN
jgi:glucose/arabinose dehydrogenase